MAVLDRDLRVMAGRGGAGDHRVALGRDGGQKTNTNKQTARTHFGNSEEAGRSSTPCEGGGP